MSKTQPLPQRSLLPLLPRGAVASAAPGHPNSTQTRGGPEKAGVGSLHKAIKQLEATQIALAAKTVAEPTTEERHAAWRVNMNRVARSSSANVASLRRTDARKKAKQLKESGFACVYDDTSATRR